MICVFVNISLWHFLLCRSNLQQLLPFLWFRWSYQPITVILLNMIKVKSRSRDAGMQESLWSRCRANQCQQREQISKDCLVSKSFKRNLNAASRTRTQSEAQRFFKFKKSSAVVKAAGNRASSSEKFNSIAKIVKKLPTFLVSISLDQELRKKLQKYLLLVALVNYSLRVSY